MGELGADRAGDTADRADRAMRVRCWSCGAEVVKHIDPHVHVDTAVSTYLLSACQFAGPILGQQCLAAVRSCRALAAIPPSTLRTTLHPFTTPAELDAIVLRYTILQEDARLLEDGDVRTRLLESCRGLQKRRSMLEAMASRKMSWIHVGCADQLLPHETT